MDQCSHGLDLHFFHDSPAVNLDGLFGDAQFRCNLLVEAAQNDQFHDFALAGREAIQAHGDAELFPSARLIAVVTSQGDLDGGKERIVFHRLEQEIDGAALHCLDGRGHVSLSGEEDDRHVDAACEHRFV